MATTDQHGGRRKSKFVNFDIVYVIVLPCVARLYVEIIHELYRVDYLTYRWTVLYHPH